MVMVSLTLVKSTNVLLCVKMNGELNIVQKVIHLSIVIAHSSLNNNIVKENGIVKISIISLLMLWLTMIPMVMVLSLLKMKLTQNTWLKSMLIVISTETVLPILVKSTNVLS